jgi:hypothetical protein
MVERSRFIKDWRRIDNARPYLLIIQVVNGRNVLTAARGVFTANNHRFNGDKNF